MVKTRFLSSHIEQGFEENWFRQEKPREFFCLLDSYSDPAARASCGLGQPGSLQLRFSFSAPATFVRCQLVCPQKVLASLLVSLIARRFISECLLICVLGWKVCSWKPRDQVRGNRPPMGESPPPPDYEIVPFLHLPHFHYYHECNFSFGGGGGHVPAWARKCCSPEAVYFSVHKYGKSRRERKEESVAPEMDTHNCPSGHFPNFIYSFNSP